MANVYLGLGSNLGDRKENLEKSIEALDNFAEIEVTNRSSILETEPYGKTDQPEFMNMCVEINTRMSPLSLLETVLGIEHSLGRVREEVWGPRIIDIDILLYEDLDLELDDLSIPHKEMHLRSFVLEPLSEIAPDVKHPTLDKLVIELKEDLEKGE
ncbi:2-amino-4-hydroxy-6-hydroxymethyldihydropteridine diphosphokinase [Lacicoccus qingdaonensis]|uniref:2-amino-4-hydroxy-6-hydroxymethyldihydropteridine diphosphokinase n=1 Tax=Lacicoccus qingdaonensis TaxID=576118 RepID=A0A1G9GHN0_9BACL|nr:2-amino-4-hydroxy-6-hydroxymethyldihydropteridine diphosphokinase [Salinicoccus qingdaonensis]SDL00184.1 2-amino-4-hydroxy-6-hydroxymethyldihydropteridinediphosphokinase/dihydroneopterin aldolase / 2-amino-4-hydroxy-6-hydroxymethyldihydropteridine diphosphokinase [Salinicoccus qingdaonensis]